MKAAKALAALTLVISSLGGTASPVSAAPIMVANPSEMSRFSPTSGDITTGRDSYGRYIYQWMYWDNPRRFEHLDTSIDAYEHEAFFKPGYCWPGNYTGSWDSNLPYPYLDTDLDDHSSTGYSRAGGSGYSFLLNSSTWYYHWLRTTTPCTPDNGTPFRVKTQDSYRQPGNCSMNFQYCVFSAVGSPRDLVPYAANWTTQGYYSYNMNQLINESFESDSYGWALMGPYGRQQWAFYSGGYEKTKFVQFNCGGQMTADTGCSIAQDRAFAIKGTDLWTYEVGLRCSSNTACPVRLVLWGLGINGNENMVLTDSIPPGGWTVRSFRVKSFNAHNTARFQIYNDSWHQNLDVDFATLHWSDTAP